MKKNITIDILFCLISFLGFLQNPEKAGVIKKNQKGVISSVEFPITVEKSEIPISAKVFFEKYSENPVIMLS